MIEKVVLENWKSYREEELVFEKGVNALVGEMGSGKSSVLEAVIYGLFGDIPARRERKISLDDLIKRVPNTEEAAVVEVVFSKEGSRFSVTRTLERDKGTTKSILRENNEVIAGPQTTEVTEKVEEIIGVDFDTFTTIIFSEQNSMDFFLNLRPSERKQKIDNLLKIDRFEDARSSIVTLKNRVKDILRSRKDDYRKMKDDFDADEVQKIDKEIRSLEKKIQEFNKEITQVDQKKKKLKKKSGRLREKKKKFENVKSQKTKLEAKIESLDERKEEKEILENFDNPREVENSLEKLEKEKERLEEFREEISGNDKELEFLEKRADNLSEEIEELKKDRKRLENKDELEKALEEKKEELEKNKDKSSKLSAELENIEESIGKLAKSSGICPTCGKPLDDKHRVEKLREFKARKSDIEKKLDKLSEERKKIEEDKDEIESERKELLKLGDVKKKLENKKEKIDDIEEKARDLKEANKDLKEKFSEERLEEIEERRKLLEQTDEYFKIIKKKKKKQKKLEETSKKLENLEFDEEKFEGIKDKLNSARSRLNVLKTQEKSKKELLDEKDKRKKEISRKKERIETFSEEIEKWKSVEDFLGRFRTSLKNTQQLIREKFVKKLNNVMEEFWDSIYPYEDYTGIRIGVDNDYVLRLKDGRDRWVSVDGEVSGGERHSAALTLRLALSSVLGHGFQVLMLDEPTHNLDERTVGDLADTLREDVSGLVEQVLLITHDRGLEDSVTSFLYRVEKDEGTGITSTNEVYSP